MSRFYRFLEGHNLIGSMSGVGSCADNAHRQYRTRAEARADIFDYIERFHNPRKRRQQDSLNRQDLHLTQPSVETG